MSLQRLRSVSVYPFGLIIFIIAGCVFVNVDKVVIRNSTDQKIEGVAVLVSEEVIWEGSLKPGEVKKISFSPKGDGSLRLYGEIAGEKIDSGSVGYFTPNGRMDHEFEIRAGGSIQYDSRPR